MKREEIEKLLNSCYTLDRVKRTIEGMLKNRDICKIEALNCDNNCSSGKKCIDCFMSLFLDTDSRLQKIDLERR